MAERVIRPAAHAVDDLAAGSQGGPSGSGGPGLATMTLCAGTLEVEHPDQVLLDYLDVRNGYAYPAYDTLETNSSASLVDGDLLAPMLLGADVDAGRFALLREMLPALEVVADLPEVALQDADDDHVLCVAGLFGILDEPRYAGRGIRGTIVSKVLHRKRPELVPIYDSRIFAAYTAPGVIPRANDRSWQHFMALLCTQMRDDLQDEAAGFAALEELAASEGTPVTQLRILDILVWRTAAAWH